MSYNMHTIESGKLTGQSRVHFCARDFGWVSTRSREKPSRGSALLCLHFYNGNFVAQILIEQGLAVQEETFHS
jgi:hypothetical protein